jgi:ribosomal protein S18 acetylase RimI-like enzyme
MTPDIRPMQMTDIAAIQEVQSLCYPASYLESREAFATKLAGAPGSCWVAQDRDGSVQAYLVCLPVDPDSFPALNAPLWTPPRQANMFYLHDLAIGPAARGTGLASDLVTHAMTHAREQALQQAGLIAVQGTCAFWRRFGFEADASGRLLSADKLASFGLDAVFMSQVLA